MRSLLILIITICNLTSTANAQEKITKENITKIHSCLNGGFNAYLKDGKLEYQADPLSNSNCIGINKIFFENLLNTVSSGDNTFSCRDDYKVTQYNVRIDGIYCSALGYNTTYDKKVDEFNDILINYKANLYALNQRILNQKKSTIKNDLVSKVLNYSSGCSDDGCDEFAWYPANKANCKYEKMTIYRDREPIYHNIQLNELDPQSISIKEYSYNGVQVLYDGQVVFFAKNVDLDRLKRGWALIYQKYCKGKKRAF